MSETMCPFLVLKYAVGGCQARVRVASDDLMNEMCYKISGRLSILVVAAATGMASASWPVWFNGDFSGSGREELARYLPDHHEWSVRSVSSPSSLSPIKFGEPGAIPVVGRFFYTGTASIAYYHPALSRWLIMKDYGDKGTIVEIPLEHAGGLPVVGDFDGDGLDDLGVYNSNDGRWSAWRSDGSLIFAHVSWGYPGVKPYAADIDGNGKAELGVYDPIRGEWNFLSVDASSAPRRIVNWGFGGVTVFVADFNGDGQTDVAVWDRHEEKWYVRNLLGGAPVYLGKTFGDLYGIPTPGRYEDGRTMNLSYVSMGHGIWHVLMHDGRVVTPGNVNIQEQ